MAKIADDAAIELPLNDERIEPRKLNRHVVVALAHMNTRRTAVLAVRAKAEKEIAELDAAILALDGKE